MNSEALDQHLRHLELVAQQVRDQGDVQQVQMDSEGVGPAMSLGDELGLIAYNLRAALEVGTPDSMSETEQRGDVGCSCGRRWQNVTLTEARRIGREHDDSPWTRHVVSSLLFMDAPAAPPAAPPDRP